MIEEDDSPNVLMLAMSSMMQVLTEIESYNNKNKMIEVEGRILKFTSIIKSNHEKLPLACCKVR